MTEPDLAADALDQVAEAAEESASEQQQIARTARALSRRKRDGASSLDLVRAGAGTTLVALLRASARRVMSGADRLQVALAHSLARDGLKTREIGEHLGVSHQRISALRAKREL